MDTKIIKGIPFLLKYAEGSDNSKIIISFENLAWLNTEIWKMSRVSQELIMNTINSNEMLDSLTSCNAIFDFEIKPSSSTYNYQFLNHGIKTIIKNIAVGLCEINRIIECNDSNIQVAKENAELRSKWTIQRNISLQQQLFMKNLLLKGTNTDEKITVSDILREYTLLNLYHLVPKSDIIYDSIESMFENFSPLNMKYKEFKNRNLDLKLKNDYDKQYYSAYASVLSESIQFVWLFEAKDFQKIKGLIKILNYKGYGSLNNHFVKNFIASNLICHLRDNGIYGELVIEVYCLNHNESIEIIREIILKYIKTLSCEIENDDQKAIIKELLISFEVSDNFQQEMVFQNLPKNENKENLVSQYSFEEFYFSINKLTNLHPFIFNYRFVQSLRDISEHSNIESCPYTNIQYFKKEFEELKIESLKIEDFDPISIELKKNDQLMVSPKSSPDLINFEEIQNDLITLDNGFKIYYIPNKKDKIYSYFKIIIQTKVERSMEGYVGVQFFNELLSLELLNLNSNLQMLGGFIKITTEDFFDIKFDLKVIDSSAIMVLKKMMEKIKELTEKKAIDSDKLCFIKKILKQKINQKSINDLIQPNETFKYMMNSLDSSNETTNSMDLLNLDNIISKIQKGIKESFKVLCSISANFERNEITEVLKGFFTNIFGKENMIRESNLNLIDAQLQNQNSTFNFKIISSEVDPEENYLTGTALLLILKMKHEKCIFYDENIEKYNQLTIFEFSSAEKISVADIKMNIILIIQDYKIIPKEFDNIKKSLIFGILNENCSIEDELLDILEMIQCNEKFSDISDFNRFKCKIIESLTIDSVELYVNEKF